MVWLKTSIGAQKVKTVCIKFRKCCEEEDREGWVHFYPMVFCRADGYVCTWGQRFVKCVIGLSLFVVQIRTDFLLLANGSESRSVMFNLFQALSWWTGVIWPCRCQKCLEQVKQEFNLVKSKLEHMFEVILFSRNALVLSMDLFCHMWTRLCQIIDPQNLTWWLEAIIYSEEALFNCRLSALVFQGMGRSSLVPHNRVWDV